MPKKIQLSIPVPCHENWEEMTPVEKGKYCGSCRKQVVDFSTMSDRQVAVFFKKPTTGSVCGRFMTDQLDREMEIPRKRIPWLKYFFTIALPAFFMSVRASAERKQGLIRLNTEASQKPVKSIKGEIAPVKCEKPVTGDTVVMPEVVIKSFRSTGLSGLTGMIVNQISPAKSFDTIKGKVIDSEGRGIPYASVCIEGAKIGVAADKDGHFNLPVGKSEKYLTVLVSSVGYMKLEKTLTSEIFDTYIPIELQMQETALAGEVLVVAGMVARKPVSRTKLAKPIPVIPAISSQTSTQLFRMYPNPVPSGSSLTIECKQTEEGYYTLQLVNLSGQAVHQQEIWIDAEARILSIDVPSLAAGSYFLVLTHKKSARKFSEKVIIL